MRSLLFCYLFFISLISSSQEVWSIEKCMQHALKNNLDLQSNQLDIQQARHNLDQRKFNYLPSLNGNASHGYNWGQRIDPFTNTFATERVRSNNFYLSSSVVLFAGLQNYFLKQEAQANLRAQEHAVEIQQRNIKIEVTAVYLQILLNQEILSSYQAQLAHTKNQMERVSRLVKAGKNTKSVQLEIEAQMALDALNITKAENDVKTAMLLLKQLLNLPKEVELTIMEPQKEEMNKEVKAVDYSILAETKQSQELYNQASNALQASKGGIYPNISLNSSIGTGFSGNSLEINSQNELVPRSFGSQINDNIYQSAILTLSLPILNNHQTTYAMQRARVEMEKARINQKKTNREVQNKVEQLLMDMDNANAQVNAAEKALEAAKTAYESARLKYENEAIHFTAYNEILTKWTQAQSNLIQAKFQKHFKRYTYSFYAQ